MKKNSVKQENAVQQKEENRLLEWIHGIGTMPLIGLGLVVAALIGYAVSYFVGEPLLMWAFVLVALIGIVISILHLPEFQSTLDRVKRINNHTILLLITIGLFIVLYTAGYLMYGYGANAKGFQKLQTFLDIFRTNAALICIACGMTCVMLTGGIDISVGSVVAMDCMFLAVGIERWIPALLKQTFPSVMIGEVEKLTEGLNNTQLYKALAEAGVDYMTPMSTYLALLIFAVLLIGAVFGAVQGFLIGYLDIQPFIVTMAGMFFARGMTAMICTDQVSIASSNWFKDFATAKIYMPFELGVVITKKGVKQVPYVGWTVIIALIVVLLVFLLLRYTRTGRGMYAVGGSNQSAALMGLNVKRTKMVTYILSSFLCSIGGILYCMNTMCGTTTQALGLEMKAISSAVIGGTLLTGGVGNVIGSFFGVLINGTITTLVSYNADLSRLGGTVPNVVSAFLLFLFIMLQAVFAKLRERKK